MAQHLIASAATLKAMKPGDPRVAPGRLAHKSLVRTPIGERHASMADLASLSACSWIAQTNVRRKALERRLGRPIERYKAAARCAALSCSAMAT